MARARGEDGYTRRAGQLAVVTELVMRGCNAAIPEVDEGTDVLAFQEEPFRVVPIQVKTARARAYRKTTGHVARFNIPMRHLMGTSPREMYYVLAVWLETRFVDYLVISRNELKAIRQVDTTFGSLDGDGNLVMTVQFRDAVLCGPTDLSRFRNAWPILPVVRVPS